jgi:hypothetical protein
MTETIHLSASFQAAGNEFICPYRHVGCRFRRVYGTSIGYRNGLIQHLLLQHNVQVFFDMGTTSLSEFADRLRRNAEKEAQDHA